MEVNLGRRRSALPGSPLLGTWLNKGRKAPQLGSTPGGIVKVGTSMGAGYPCNYLAKYGSKF